MEKFDFSGKLSENFTLAELTVARPEWLERNRAAVTEAGKKKLILIATDLLQPVRNKFGRIIVSSGFRSAEYNKYIGGSPTSQHAKFEAADFQIINSLPETLEKVFDWIRLCSDIKFGQLIFEEYKKPYPRWWIHISLGEPYRAKEKCGQVFKFIEMTDGTVHKYQL